MPVINLDEQPENTSGDDRAYDDFCGIGDIEWFPGDPGRTISLVRDRLVVCCSECGEISQQKIGLLAAWMSEFPQFSEIWLDPDRYIAAEEAISSFIEQNRATTKSPNNTAQVRAKYTPLDPSEYLVRPENRGIGIGGNTEFVDPTYEELLEHEVSYHGQANIMDMNTHARTMYVVLLPYSGRRRHGDIQLQIEWVTAYKTYDVLVLSLDLAVHATKGDMSNKGTVAFWRGQIMSKRVCGMAAGPPCESWSVVRYMYDVDCPIKQPRPLRSREYPWGLRNLKLAEYRQIGLANQLLFVVLDFVLDLVNTGGFALIEHPGEPKHRIRAPSIWRTPQVTWLLNAPAIQHINMNQGVHGQISKKPTGLLALRLPTLKRYIHKRQGVVEDVNMGVLGGWDDHRKCWRTSAAKEYPPSMCRAISLAITDSIDALHGDPSNGANTSDRCEDLLDTYSTYDAYLEAQPAAIGKDCALFNRP